MTGARRRGQAGRPRGRPGTGCRLAGLLAATALLTLVGCGPKATPAGSCGPVERPPIQGGGHLIGGQQPPVPYSSVPPTSGWHASGAFEIAVQPPDAPLSEPRQVSVLEAGGVVISYRQLPQVDRAALEELVRSRFAGRAAVTPYDQLAPGQVVMTAWGMLQRCQRPDLDAVARFIDAHAQDRPAAPGHR